MDVVSDSSAGLYAEYRREIEAGPLPRSLRNAVIVFAGLQTCVFIPADWVLYPESFGFFLSLRLTLNVVLGVIFFWMSRSFPVSATMLTCFAGGAMFLGMVQATGGVTSGYYVGLILLMVGLGVLVPLSGGEAFWIVAVLVGVYASLPALSREPVAWTSFLQHLFFLGAAAMEAVMSCALLDRMRFADFRQRHEIERVRDELSQLDQAKSRFSANVHHELRTPLTLILAPLDTLRSGDMGEFSEAVQRMLRTMQVNGRRLLKMINNLLDLAKIESQEFRIQRRPMTLGPLVAEVIDGAASLAERKGVRISGQGLDDIGDINGDPDAIEKIVLNLVGNALKFTDSGGSIVVSTEPSEAGGVHLRVADTGIGIPADQLAEIFDRFAQVDASATRKHEGTGIGLSLAHEMVMLHQGRIWAESRGAGCGTTMHVVLPRGEMDAPQEEDVLSDGTGRILGLGRSIEAIEAELNLGSGAWGGDGFSEVERAAGRGEEEKRTREPEVGPQELSPDTPEVLIVEDNQGMRELLAMLLAGEFRVRVARDGREALDALRESAPDLVLSDVMMPEMSGTELCRAIKEDETTRAIPVVLVTSKAEREMKIEGLELGADDYVTKPFHPRELLARVHSLVRVRGLQKELARRNEALERALAELKRAEVKLVQSERLAAVGELAAGIAHEVNNPVNFALNAARAIAASVKDVRRVADQLAELDGEDAGRLASQVAEYRRLRDEIGMEELAETLSELAEIVGDGLKRTSALVGELRDFAAPGRKEKEGRAHVDVGKGVESTVHLLKHSLAKAGAEIQVKIAEHVPPIRGDGGALNQVFLNLIKNAADSLSDRGGVIQVEVCHADGELRITVEDDGSGMTAEVRDRIFEPFFTTREAGRGTGLGLSISRQIVEAHGGWLDAQSELDVGSTFVIHLPVEEAGTLGSGARSADAGEEGCAT
jgi:signal transduction histidine kinase